MGQIIFWTLIRLALTIPLLWFLQDYFDYNYWFIILVFVLYGFVIHPAIISYKKFEEENETIINNSLCSSCKNFDKSAVICIKYDEHPNENYIPCNGVDWEPKP